MKQFANLCELLIQPPLTEVYRGPAIAGLPKARQGLSLLRTVLFLSSFPQQCDRLTLETRLGYRQMTSQPREHWSRQRSDTAKKRKATDMRPPFSRATSSSSFLAVLAVPTVAMSAVTMTTMAMPAVTVLAVVMPMATPSARSNSLLQLLNLEAALRLVRVHVLILALHGKSPPQGAKKTDQIGNSTMKQRGFGLNAKLAKMRCQSSAFNLD